MYLTFFFFFFFPPQTLVECHPSGINTHTSLSIPDHVSKEARSLIQQVIKGKIHFQWVRMQSGQILAYLSCSGEVNIRTEGCWKECGWVFCQHWWFLSRSLVASGNFDFCLCRKPECFAISLKNVFGQCWVLWKHLSVILGLFWNPVLT